MSLSIRIADANFTHVAASLSLPNRSGLLAEYTFGESDAKSLVNRAFPTAAPLTKVGDPVYGANYAEIRAGSTAGSAGFDTGFVRPAKDISMIVVVQKGTTCPPWMVSQGFSGFANYTNVPSFYNRQTGALTGVADLPLQAHTDFAFWAGTGPLGGLGKIHTYAAGVLSSATAETVGGTIAGTSNIMIGTTVSSAGVGIANIAYAAMFERVLPDAEIAAAYASLKAYMATRGVTVS